MFKEFKPPLTIEEQITYIKDKKNVVYNIVDEKEAEKLLYEHCYINLITPYKRRFAKKDKHGRVKRDSEGNHIYPKEVEFAEYRDAYEKERNSYPQLYSSIIRFESAFNSILTYEMIHYYSLSNTIMFQMMQEMMHKNLESSDYEESTKEKMRQEISHFNEDIERYDSIYIFFDRSSLSRSITLFRCCDPDLKNKIFKELFARGYTLGYEDLPTFDSDLFDRLVQIRNCICHGNSLEVLLNYYRIKSKTIRKRSDRKRYETIIKKLLNNE